MANRSYLYTTDEIPVSNPPSGRIRGLSEWNSEVPLAYKVLLSGQPRVTRSAIWPDQGEIALAADFALGVEKLRELARRVSTLEVPLMTELAEETFAFLQSPANRRKFFFLEAGEIFDLEDEDLAVQCRALLSEIESVDIAIEKWIAQLTAASPHKRDKEILGLGIDNWSNILYYDLESPPGEVEYLPLPPADFDAITRSVDRMLRTVCSGDSAFLRDWPTMTLTVDSPAPQNEDAENLRCRVWSATANFAEPGDLGIDAKEQFSLELFVELAELDELLLTITWIVFPHEEVFPALTRSRSELLHQLNSASADYGIKFRLHEDRKNTYICCEMSVPFRVVDDLPLSWALSESLDAAMRHFEAIDAVLAGNVLS